ncbi:hypothetical protein SIID45300_02396 [Candidatus Magnetaquicoccaceae bacterium FCR-1]|uniref:Phage head morphogenesis domain-containing protein n=1 Tax=Candidatus Magnetaquiglobus chichijimensis TaxID=3141448 RepID=A0ABQ0CAZ9_9PROT
MNILRKVAQAIQSAHAKLMAIYANTFGEVERLLDATSDEIQKELDKQPSDWKTWHLQRLKQEVRRSLDWFGERSGAVAASGARDGWEAGVQSVDDPIAVARGEPIHDSPLPLRQTAPQMPSSSPPASVQVPLVSSPPHHITVGVQLPALDNHQLVAIEGFLTHKMKDVSADMVKAINRELGLVVTGLQNQSDAATAIEKLLKVGGRRRALTVVRTEIGRAFSMAAQRRMEEKVAAGMTGLKKKWRRSGKIHSRQAHDLADGQVVAVHESFMVGGQPIRYPRDPNAPPAQTINCGCTAIAHMDHWEMLHPGDKPFTEEEIQRNPRHMYTANSRAEGVAKWIQTTLEGKRKANGEWRTVGTLPMPVVDFLRAKGVEPASMEIAISDKLLKRPAREMKRHVWMKGLENDELVGMSAHIDNPKAIYWGKHDHSLHYVFARKDQGLGKLVVRVRARESRSTLKHHNYIISGGSVNRTDVMDTNQYQLISGAI